ncbi:RidA family protein [Halomonas sp. hl-4]|uniref:RidA family protein n=1 Tax=Halomonas sp. hl-4 TaxID=1761789 RepID=UPI0012FE3B7B|nr:RidA family protein [Halomonas sp. hl-4]
MKSTVEECIRSLGLELPVVTTPRGNFRSYIISNNMLYLSGKGAPLREEGVAVPKVGQEVTIEQARAYAQEVGLYLLALIKEALGDFDRVQRVVKMFGMAWPQILSATPDQTGRVLYPCHILNSALKNVPRSMSASRKA